MPLSAMSIEWPYYVSLSNMNNTLGYHIYNFDDTGAIVSGDLAAPAKYCTAESSYYCFITPKTAFSYPKKKTAVGDKWLMFGWEFKKLPYITINTFGKKTETIVVSAKNLINWGKRDYACDHVFLFQEDNGVIADLVECKNIHSSSHSSYWLKSSFGVNSQQFLDNITLKASLTKVQEKLLFKPTEEKEYGGIYECTFSDRCECILNEICSNEPWYSDLPDEDKMLFEDLETTLKRLGLPPLKIQSEENIHQNNDNKNY